MQVLKGFLLRDSIILRYGDHGDKYKETLEYAKFNEDFLDIFNPLWPEYQKARHIYRDYTKFVNLSVPELYFLHKMVQSSTIHMVDKLVSSENQADCPDPSEGSNSQSKFRARSKIRHREDSHTTSILVDKKDLK